MFVTTKGEYEESSKEVEEAEGVDLTGGPGGGGEAQVIEVEEEGEQSRDGAASEASAHLEASPQLPALSHSPLSLPLSPLQYIATQTMRRPPTSLPLDRGPSPPPLPPPPHPQSHVDPLSAPLHPIKAPATSPYINHHAYRSLSSLWPAAPHNSSLYHHTSTHTSSSHPNTSTLRFPPSSSSSPYTQAEPHLSSPAHSSSPHLTSTPPRFQQLESSSSDTSSSHAPPSSALSPPSASLPHEDLIDSAHPSHDSGTMSTANQSSPPATSHPQSFPTLPSPNPSPPLHTMASSASLQASAGSNTRPSALGVSTQSKPRPPALPDSPASISSSGLSSVLTTSSSLHRTTGSGTIVIDMTQLTPRKQVWI